MARLPQSVRERLNERIEDGEPGAGLAEWLNSLEEEIKGGSSGNTAEGESK